MFLTTNIVKTLGDSIEPSSKVAFRLSEIESVIGYDEYVVIRTKSGDETGICMTWDEFWKTYKANKP